MAGKRFARPKKQRASLELQDVRRLIFQATLRLPFSTPYACRGMAGTSPIGLCIHEVCRAIASAGGGMSGGDHPDRRRGKALGSEDTAIGRVLKHSNRANWSGARAASKPGPSLQLIPAEYRTIKESTYKPSHK
jgi:hypothetical protein